MRKTLFLALMGMILTLRGPAQVPTDGHLTANSYANTFFNLSYSWPKMLQPADPASFQFRKSPYNNEFFLFSLQQGDTSFGVLAVAEKTGPTPHSGGFQNPSEFIDFVIHSFNPEENLKILARKTVRNPDGIEFEELDYGSKYDKFASGIATQSGQFLMVFRCSAQSAADLSTMTKSVLASHRLK